MANFAYINSSASTLHQDANSSWLSKCFKKCEAPYTNVLAPDAGIEMDNITIQRDGKAVIRDLSLKIDAGSITAIVGPSGAGKTTLIRTLNGLLQPRTGCVKIGSNFLNTPELLREHRLQTSTIFQEHALIDRLSALDNVLLGFADERVPLSILPWSNKSERQAVNALKEVGLLHLAHTRASNLSGGERQRVGIARALVRKPKLLLADEPFAAVDPALARQLGNEFRNLVKASGITVVVVLHQIDIARSLADRIVGLTKAGITFDAPASKFDGVAHDHLFSISSRH
jgi:phosphonate transport system ATP-binding protein